MSWPEATCRQTFRIASRHSKPFGRPPSRAQHVRAVDLFQRYDEDGGGTIDKFEFAELAREVEANYKRRTLLTGATAAVGALVVNRYSEEYAWAQKTFRGLYIEQKAEAVQKK